jgi:hypothetical protein
MSLKHPGSGDTLFLSVDNQWNDTTRCVFAFVEAHEKDAIRTVNTLAALMVKKNPVRAEYFFTKKALETAKTYKWDEHRKCFMTLDEIFYLEMDVWGADTLLMGIDQNSVQQTINAEKKTKLDMTEKPPSRIERLYNGTDACSVGTVASRVNSKRIKGALDDDTDAASDGGDSISTSASVRSRRNKSQDSKMTVMEANLLHNQRAIIDMSVILESLAKHIYGTDPASTPANPKKTTIIEDSATSKLAPNTGDRKDSGDGK